MTGGDDDRGFFLSIETEFESDLNCLVVTNHKLTLQAIANAEAKITQEIVDSVGDYDGASSTVNFHRQQYEDLRHAANGLAVVALVTRLAHRINVLLETKRGSSVAVISGLELLNEQKGIGPVPIEFFDKLVTVRDSVIHADSESAWKFNGRVRRVAAEYTNEFDRVELTDEQVQTAVQNTIKQMDWYAGERGS